MLATLLVAESLLIHVYIHSSVFSCWNKQELQTSRSEGNALMAQSRVEAVVKACSWEWEGNLHVRCRPNEPHITQKAQLWLLMSH